MKVIGFETVKELYKDDPDFQKFWNATDSQSSQDYYRHEGFLFKGKTLCIPQCSLREANIWEAHDGGLASHIGQDLKEMSTNIFKDVESAIWPRPKAKTLVFTCHSLF